MPPRVVLYGKEFVIKQNPWLSGKLADIPTRRRRPFLLAKLPPWAYNAEALSNAQLMQITRFSRVAAATKGISMKERVARLKAEASGPTGYPLKPRAYVPRFGMNVISAIAARRGVAATPRT